jgi:hypothetical protein
VAVARRAENPQEATLTGLAPGEKHPASIIPHRNVATVQIPVWQNGFTRASTGRQASSFVPNEEGDIRGIPNQYATHTGAIMTFPFKGYEDDPRIAKGPMAAGHATI